MEDRPIIVKITYQITSGYEPRFDGSLATIIYNEAEDKEGQRWSFYRKSWADSNGLECMGSAYNFARLPAIRRTAEDRE